MLIAGIDEAGRGPCIGPLVMAVTLIEKEREQELVDIGVTDSKLLSADKREKFAKLIKKIALEYYTVQIKAEEIDELRVHKSLNEIEAMKAAKLLMILKKKPDIVYVDSPDTVMAEFGKRMQNYLPFKTRIVSEHKADLNYPVVSAASILAKVERDRQIKNIGKKFGNVGSGYPGDEVTIKFLKNYLVEHNEAPHFARKSWQTIIQLVNNRFQKKLFGAEKNDTMEKN